MNSNPASEDSRWAGLDERELDALLKEMDYIYQSLLAAKRLLSINVNDEALMEATKECLEDSSKNAGRVVGELYKAKEGNQR